MDYEVEGVRPRGRPKNLELYNGHKDRVWGNKFLLVPAYQGHPH